MMHRLYRFRLSKLAHSIVAGNRDGYATLPAKHAPVLSKPHETLGFSAINIYANDPAGVLERFHANFAQMCSEKYNQSFHKTGVRYRQTANINRDSGGRRRKLVPSIHGTVVDNFVFIVFSHALLPLPLFLLLFLLLGLVKAFGWTNVR